MYVIYIMYVMYVMYVIDIMSDRDIIYEIYIMNVLV